MRGRPPTRKKGAYTVAERARNYRQRLKRSRPDPKTVAKQQRRNAREAELGAKIWALPERRAGILLIDAPIDWEPYSRITGMDRHAANHYAVMAFAEFAETVPELPAAADSIAFMWAFRDYPRRRAAETFLEARGFEHKTLQAWHKTVGTGYILRDNCELLLIASRGNPVWPAFGQQAWAAIKAPVEPWDGLFDGIIEAAKPYPRHSQKPEIFADHISRLWPNTPKLEMYYRAFPDPEAELARRAKREAAGWYFYGNEADAPPLDVGSLADTALSGTAAIGEFPAEN
jgi:N6-adenosine-specific RNA methylase IME4